MKFGPERRWWSFRKFWVGCAPCFLKHSPYFLRKFVKFPTLFQTKIRDFHTLFQNKIDDFSSHSLQPNSCCSTCLEAPFTQSTNPYTRLFHGYTNYSPKGLKYFLCLLRLPTSTPSGNLISNSFACDVDWLRNWRVIKIHHHSRFLVCT